MGIALEQADEHRRAGTAFLPGAFELCELPPVAIGPVPTDEVVEAAGFAGWNVDAPADDVVAMLRDVIQMQRQSVYSDLPCYVGGFAQLTTISANEISQRILCRWPDNVGEQIFPKAINCT